VTRAILSTVRQQHPLGWWHVSARRQRANEQAADISDGIRRVTVEEASSRLGLCENAVRKRKERGSFPILVV